MPTDTSEQRRRRDDLAALLLLLADDVPAARELWQAHTPKAFHGMLDGDGFTFDPVAQVYRTTSGRAVKDDDLKRLSLLFVVGVDEELRRDTREATRNPAKVDGWSRRTAGKLRSEYLALAGLAVGGFDRLTPADYATITGSPDSPPGLAFSLNRLAAFADDLESGEAGTELEVLSRVGMYAESANSIYEEMRRLSHMRARDDRGRLLYLEEENVLDDTANHCHNSPSSPGCPELTALGWVPIGTMPPPGLRTCLTRCHCRLRFRLTGPAVNN